MKEAEIGLKANWKQFTILVLVNAFVGGMVGLERSIFPQFASIKFGIVSNTAILSFIIVFGASKAISNYFTGRLANRFGRKNLLIAGWILALPIPFMLIYANSWTIVVLSNVLLGIHQGLTWSSTVVMKIDLVGQKDRGLAMGLNEFAGYLAVGIMALLTGYVASNYGVSPYPFYLGFMVALIGLLLTIFFVKETTPFMKLEQVDRKVEKLKNIFWETTYKNPTLGSVTQAGLVNNLNDGMIWGLLPILLMSLHYSNAEIGVIASIYPTVWGVSQLITGKLSDSLSKKRMLFWGMLLQGITIVILPFFSGLWWLIFLSVLLGIGTALVYPTFLSTIAEATLPNQRAESIGTFRLWRDLGYAIGAIISGISADLFGLHTAIIFIGIITILSALIIEIRMSRI
ncbi:MAG: MFS transporter [Chitinophagaceae bacterium]